MTQRPTVPKVVNAIKGHGRVGKGVSGSHYLECDDGNIYVVKFLTEDDSDKTIINEFLSYLIGSRLNCPLSDFKFVVIPKELILLDPDLSKRNIKIEPTPIHHFGSLKLENAFDFEDPRFPKTQDYKTTLDRIENKSQMPSVVILDNLVIHNDRHFGNNMLQVTSQTPLKYKYYCVDFSVAFKGHKWINNHLAMEPNLAKLSPSCLPMLSLPLEEPQQMEEEIRKLEAIKDDEISGFVAAIPSSWHISNSERQTLETFLKKRRDRIKEILINRDNVLEVFPNLKEGSQLWMRP